MQVDTNATDPARAQAVQFDDFCVAHDIHFSGASSVPAIVEALGRNEYVLINGDDTTRLVIDSFADDHLDERVFGTVRDNFVPELISSPELARLIERGTALRLTTRDKTAPSVRLPSGASVQFNCSWMGGIVPRPFSLLERTVIAKNTGGRTLRFGDAHSSCGCMTIPDNDFADNLQPGDTAAMRIQLRTSTRVAMRQIVHLPIVDRADDTSSEHAQLSVFFPVYAWQYPTIDVSPPSIDFGTISQGSPPRRLSTILNEPPTDRFVIKAVDVPDGITTHVASEKPTSAGLAAGFVARHIVTVTVDPNVHQPRDYKDNICIRTTSRRRPDLNVPVHFIVAPRVTARPPELFIQTGSHAGQVIGTFRLVTDDVNPITAEICHAPPGITIDGPDRFVRSGIFVARDTEVSRHAHASLVDDMSFPDDCVIIKLTGMSWSEELQLHCKRHQDAISAVVNTSPPNPSTKE